jgi:hypothetical protein
VAYNPKAPHVRRQPVGEPSEWRRAALGRLQAAEQLGIRFATIDDVKMFIGDFAAQLSWSEIRERVLQLVGGLDSHDIVPGATRIIRIGRVVGGTETPTIEEVNDEQNKKIKAIVQSFDLPEERKALAEANFEDALRATEDGVSLAELAQKAGVTLGRIELLSDWEQAIVEVAPNLTKEEQRKIWNEALAVTKPPIPELTSKQITAIERVAQRNRWSSRPTYHHSPFDWVKEHYGRWVPGLLQPHLKLDPSPLYDAFVKRIKREGGLPEWLDVPTQGEAELRNAVDPIQRARILAVRRLSKAQSHGVRSLRRTAAPPPKL